MTMRRGRSGFGYWGNDYFDDTYERNTKFEKFEGNCTDVWFREGMRFIEKNQSKPFLLYLATKAPHGQTMEQPVKAGSNGVVFEVDLPSGQAELATYLYDKNGNAGGAYFTEVEALGSVADSRSKS